jgi:hypothetical protein
MWVYSESANSYSEITDNTTTLSALEGYVVRLGTTDTYTFSGTDLNNGAISATNLTRTGTVNSKRGYHLISNPYPSYLDWDAVDATNLSSTMWYRTAGTTGMVFDTYNSSGGISVSNSGDPVTQYIPPMQAFWVYVENDGETGAITFDNTMRSHQPSAFGIKSGDDHAAFVRLNLLNGDQKDQTVVYFNENANDGFDTYDSKKQFVSNQSQLYTKIDEQELVINGLNNIEANSSIDLFMHVSSTDELTLFFEEAWVNDGELILEDKLNESFTFISEGTAYVFSAEEGEAINRFVLHFNKSTASVNQIALDAIAIRADKHGNLEINLPQTIGDKGVVNISDLSGRIVYNSNISSGSNQMKIDEMSGIYVVNVESNATVASYKMIIIK